ncbi:hypothetical protein CRUP_031507 [Coryphaenoides rupestris]|nr:hypothetical protein CRUP_031507 [Coryphaenoides rupestris]
MRYHARRSLLSEPALQWRTAANDLLGKHCSNIAPAPIISSGPSLHIKFVSDYAHQGAGFSLRYEIFKTGE